EHIVCGRLIELLPGYRLPDLWLKALVPSNRVDLPRIRALLAWLASQLAERPLWQEPPATAPGSS
ncbi:MAG: LysR family transcriptional regulator, partial [Burkholderiaceae bacterium]